MTWKVHLARKHPTKLLCLIGISAFVATTAYWVIGSLGSVFTAVLMIASSAEFIFPTRYTLTRESAVCRTLLKQSEIKWADVRRCYVDDMGVKLSPLDRQSRLEAFRGVYLRFADNEAGVIEAVKSLRPDGK